MGTELGTSADNDPGTNALQQAYVQTLEGNPGIPTPVIREAYFICLTQANRTIDITTPCFVPDADIIMAIKTTVARKLTEQFELDLANSVPLRMEDLLQRPLSQRILDQAACVLAPLL